MNEPTSFNRPAFLISAVMVTVMILLSGGMGLYIISDPALDNAYMIAKAAQTIEENYPDKIDWEKLSAVGREAMFARLDRYSSFYPTQQFDRLDEELGGSYSGIGITVVTHDEGLLIMSVRENGPADDAGLLSGDIITKVDSVSLVDLSGGEAIRGLRGEEDAGVMVSVYRPVTEERFDVEIIRKKIHLLHIPFAGLTDDSVLYIRLLDFDPGAAEDLEATLDSLVLNRTPKPRGVILDLRENPGGLFSEAYDVANLFLNEGIFIVGTEGKSRWGNRTFFSTDNDVTSGLPLAVMVNGGSASASEIVAGALQKSHRAILVGDTTFGKGLVQGFVRFPEGDGLKLTMSRYYLEGRQFLNEFDSLLIDTGTGLLPDFYYQFTTPTIFKRELENSMLLRSFAVEYEDELIQQYQSGNTEDGMIELFIQYCAANDFVFQSYRTLMILEMFVLAKEEDRSDKIEQLLNAMLKKSQAEDKNQFYDESKYISQRLAEIAYERRFGEYKSYKEVLLRMKPEIEYTTDLLLGETVVMEMLLFIGCGLLAGLLGGYLGLGGGIIMVPFLTVVTGLDIKEAVPVSVTAIVVSSLASSNEYLKKGLVDLELVIILALFMVMGTVTGTSLAEYFPAQYLQLALTVILLYTAFSLFKNKKEKQPSEQIDNRNKHILISSLVALVTGFLAGLLGIGGGVIVVPVLYLLIGLPLSYARGTSALMVGFSAAAASTVYLINGLINIEIAVLVILGIIVGGKIGGKLGSVAKPKPVKILFFFLMLYLAYKLSYGPLKELL